MKKSYRSNDNFEEAVGIFMDNDNDHSENPADWLTAEKLSELLCDVDHVIAPSRHNMLPKDNKAARPRQHIYFPTAVFTDRKKYEELKAAIQRMYPFFDDNAKDAARFFFGSACSEDDLIWNEGWLTIDEAVDEEALVPNSDEDEDFGAPASSGPILEGSRNNTMCMALLHQIREGAEGLRRSYGLRNRASDGNGKGHQPGDQMSIFHDGHPEGEHPSRS